MVLDRTRGGRDDTHPPPMSSKEGPSIPFTSGVNWALQEIGPHQGQLPQLCSLDEEAGRGRS